MLQSQLPSLDLSNTKISTINNSTFNGAASLKEVKLPSTVQTIGQNAFKNTAALKTLTQAAPAGAVVTRVGGNQLASTLTSIGGNAFEATGLESLDLSQVNMTTLNQQQLFLNAASLSDLKLPTGLTNLSGNAMFAGTSALKSLEIPSTVTTLGNSGSNAPLFSAYYSSPTPAGYQNPSGIQSLDLSKLTSLQAIQPNCFAGASNLTSVTLPAGLQTIPSYAFYNSPKLKTVSFASASTPEAQRSTRATEGTLDFSGASSLTSIGNNAFQGTGATTVDLSGVTNSSFTTISNSAFMGMNELTTVKLPASVTAINANAFANNAKLATLFQESPSGEASRDTTSSTPTLTTDSAKFGSSLTTIQQGAFQGTGFKIVDLSQANSNLTLNNNNNKPFGNLANLITVKLPASSNLDLGNFSGGSTWSVQFGSNTTSPAVVQFSDATFSRSNYNRIINSTIEMQSSSTGNPVTLSAGLFNGNSTLTTLKLNRTATTLSATDNNLWAFQLGTAPNGSNLDAAYSTAPLGNNSKLTNIEFKGFTLGNTTQVTESSNNQWSKINDNTTWSQVASIMNMFSKWTASESESARTDETVSAPTNLMAWPANGNSWINDDLTGSSSGSGNKVNEGWTITNPSPSNQTLIASTKTATKTHNGVEWKYENKGATTTGRDGNSTTNEITITGQVNIYKSKNSTNFYQTYFNTEEGKTEPTKTITIKLILVPATTTEAIRK